MNSRPDIEKLLGKLESEFGPDTPSFFFDGLRDSIVRGDTEHDDDNPHMRNEEPCYSLYKLGAATGQNLLKQLRSRPPLPVK